MAKDAKVGGKGLGTKLAEKFAKHKVDQATWDLFEANLASLRTRNSKPFKTTTLDKVVGCAGYNGPSMTVEDMEQAIQSQRRARAKRKARKPERP